MIVAFSVSMRELLRWETCRCGRFVGGNGSPLGVCDFYAVAEEGLLLLVEALLEFTDCFWANFSTQFPSLKILFPEFFDCRLVQREVDVELVEEVFQPYVVLAVDVVV